MSTPLGTSVRVNFAVSPFDSTSDGVSLEEDRDIAVDPVVTTYGPFSSSWVKSDTYVRLYKPQGMAISEVSVVAVTGTIIPYGSGVTEAQEALLSFSPGSQSQGLPTGTISATIETVGRAFSESGESVPVEFIYDRMLNAVKCNVPAFAFARVTVTREYSLFRYTFSGTCPTPTELDEQIDLGAGPARPTLENGLIYALVAPTEDHDGSNASLNLQPPECNYGTTSMNFLDTSNTAKVSNISAEVDPKFGPRLVASTDGTIMAECQFRVYSGGETVFISATDGAHWPVAGEGSESTEEMLVFNNSVSQTVSKIPMNGVSISTELNIGGTAFVGPGHSVTDVTWLSTDRKAYTNPRSRETGLAEITSVWFNKPVPAMAIVKASYTYSFSTYGYRFAFDPYTNEFKPAHLFIRGSSGKATVLTLSPPTTKSSTRRVNG